MHVCLPYISQNIQEGACMLVTETNAMRTLTAHGDHMLARWRASFVTSVTAADLIPDYQCA